MKPALRVFEGNIATLRDDVVVNAANDQLWMGAGVAGALKRAAGDGIEREAMAKGPIAIGSAIYTSGWSLPCRWVVHAAVMGQDLETSSTIIGQATGASLAVAERLGATSIAFPAFGTGVGGFDLDECARIMVNVVAEHDGSIARAVFAAFDARAAKAFISAIREVRR